MIKQWGCCRSYFVRCLYLSGLFCLTLLMVSTVWAGHRFKINPDEVATAEVQMWKAYYSNNVMVLRRELLKLIRSQFSLSIMEAMNVCEPLALAAMKFDKATSDYKLKVLPDLERAYVRLKNATGILYDPKEAARAELDWWVARRTPGIDNPQEVGHRIALLYTVIFGKSSQKFEQAGLLRAQAAHLRDKGGAMCDWKEVERLLLESYRILQEGL